MALRFVRLELLLHTDFVEYGLYGGYVLWVMLPVIFLHNEDGRSCQLSKIIRLVYTLYYQQIGLAFAEG